MKNFYEDLREEIRKDKEHGRHVVVGGDFNETYEEEGMMNTTMEEAGMVNYFHQRMGKVPPTRKPGRRAIDHI